MSIAETETLQGFHSARQSNVNVFVKHELESVVTGPGV
jgi:hypothetical protein